MCVPFGLSTAPFIFTKIMKVVIRYLRNKGFTSVIYLDDYLGIEESFEACKALLEFLGFTINSSKSELIPSQRCTFLGIIIDTVRYCVELNQMKPMKRESN